MRERDKDKPEVSLTVYGILYFAFLKYHTCPSEIVNLLMRYMEGIKYIVTITTIIKRVVLILTHRAVIKGNQIGFYQL